MSAILFSVDRKQTVKTSYTVFYITQNPRHEILQLITQRYYLDIEDINYRYFKVIYINIYIFKKCQ